MMGKVRGLYLHSPYGAWLASGRTRAVLQPRPYEMSGEWLAVLEDQVLLGLVRLFPPFELDLRGVEATRELHLVSDEELCAWWPDADRFWLYIVEKVDSYPQPVPYDVPPGVQTFLPEVVLPKPFDPEAVKKEAAPSVRFMGTKGLNEHSASRHRWNASLLLTASSGQTLLIDKGVESMPGLRADFLLCTHAHPDHAGGFHDGDEVWCGPDVGNLLKEFAPGARPQTLPPRQAFQLGPFTVTAIPVLHSHITPTYGFRITWDGVSIWYAPDIAAFMSEQDKELALNGVDLFIGDGSRSFGTLRWHEDTLIGHAPYSTQCAWAKAFEIPGVIFTHFGEEWLSLTPSRKKKLKEELERDYGLDVRFAEDGLVTVVSPRKQPPKPKAPSKSSSPDAALAKAFDPERITALEAAFDLLPEEFLVCPEWASLTGGTVYGEEPHDIDVILRTEAPSGALVKLERALRDYMPVNGPVQFSLDPAGPTWAYVPLYDLIARRRSAFSLKRLDELEPDFAREYYKTRVLSDPQNFRPHVPIAHYSVQSEFYYPQDLDLAWDKWAARALARGDRILIQPKFDGIRFILSVTNSRLSVFSEKGLECSHAFPGLGEALRELGLIDVVMDCEFVEYTNETFTVPVSRTEMAWMVAAKEPKEAPVCIFVHDLIWARGENLASKSYLERFLRLAYLLPQPRTVGRYRLARAPTRVVTNKKSFEEAIGWAVNARELSSEGAMLKLSSFVYDPRTKPAVAKIKQLIELDGLILGYRKIPAPKPPGVHWTREEALRALPRALEESRTYSLRVGFLSEETGKLIPVETKHRLTERDLNFDWDEEKQAWIGVDDPRLWTNFPGVPERGRGEYAYGTTYNIALPEPPQPGDVICVAPMKLTLFEDEAGWHVTWQHPIVRHLKEKPVPVGTIESALRAHRLAPQDFTPWAVQWEVPTWLRS